MFSGVGTNGAKAKNSGHRRRRDREQQRLPGPAFRAYREAGDDEERESDRGLRFDECCQGREHAGEREAARRAATSERRSGSIATASTSPQNGPASARAGFNQ